MEFQELQKRTLELPEPARATLAAELLPSFLEIRVDQDDGIAEAQRRSKEPSEDPSMGCSWKGIKSALGR
jgi:hypothetical protein